ncbi:MAG: type II secretion system protein, partial [Calditrichaeota bacterium]
MWRNERGLTLIELCLTLLVFSLIVLAATPKLAHTYRNLRLKSQAEAVAREFKLLPQESLLTGRTWRFTVWENGNGYSVEEQVVPENFQQPVWKWQPRWRVKQRHVFPEGMRLHPKNLR